MSEPATFRLLSAAVYFVPGLLWAVFAQSIWGFLRKRRPRSRAFVALFIVGGLVALHYALWVLIALARSRATRVALLAASDADTAVLLALGRHFARLWPVRADPPRPGWLGVNYGVAALAAAVFVLADLGSLVLPGATSFVPFTAYLLAMAALTVWDVQRLARSAPGSPMRRSAACSTWAPSAGWSSSSCPRRGGCAPQSTASSSVAAGGAGRRSMPCCTRSRPSWACSSAAGARSGSWREPCSSAAPPFSSRAARPSPTAPSRSRRSRRRGRAGRGPSRRTPSGRAAFATCPCPSSRRSSRRTWSRSSRW